MKNLLALLGLAIVVVGGVGYYQGWFKFSVSRNLDGSLRVQTDVNTAQASSDISQIGKKVEDIVEKHIEPSTAPATTHGPMTTPATSSPTSSPTSLQDGAGWLLGNVLGNKQASK
jgi:hypothetical protein